jgi:hypothetical protein
MLALCFGDNWMEMRFLLARIRTSRSDMFYTFLCYQIIGGVGAFFPKRGYLRGKFPKKGVFEAEIPQKGGV